MARALTFWSVEAKSRTRPELVGSCGVPFPWRLAGPVATNDRNHRAARRDDGTLPREGNGMGIAALILKLRDPWAGGRSGLGARG